MTPICNVALMYDFDKTLCPKDMQEYAFIPSLNTTAAEFWAECNEAARKHVMDDILAYMYVMLYKARAPLTKARLKRQGKSVELFDGVAAWFPRINRFAAGLGINLEHYIISSGLKQIIMGTPIAKYFKEVYACDFVYNEKGRAVWPALAMNYTSKTQFLFRINKGVRDITKHDELNAPTHEDDRRVPFRNMVYIGDGLTDVPCMKLVKMNGGHSIGVFSGDKKATVSEMMIADRVDFAVPCDYRAGGELDRLIRLILSECASASELRAVSRTHYKEAERLHISSIIK